MSESISSITVAIAYVRSQGIVCIKSGRNAGINSDYATYVDIWEALKPHLTAAGLTVGFAPGKVRPEGTASNAAWVQTLCMEVVWQDKTEKIDFEVLFPEGNRGVNLTQRQGMSHTYGRRYALIDYFHIITGDDDDAQRLGQPATDSAPRADTDAHWRQFCHVPVFDLGTAETAATWTMLADPSDESGHRILGDLQGGAMAKLWCRYPENPGINAWRAELIGDRAKAKSIRTWEECVSLHKTLNLPDLFVACTGEQLSNLALALAPQTGGKK